MKDYKKLKITGYVLYVVGTILGMALFATILWGYLEASVFFPLTESERNLQKFTCPVMINEQEEKEVFITLINPHDEKDLRAYVVAQVSVGFSADVRELKFREVVPPNSTAQISLPITAADAVFYDRMAFIHILQYNNLDLPVRNSMCGIIVMPNLQMPGDQFFMILAIGTSAVILLGLGVSFLTMDHRTVIVNDEYKYFRIMALTDAGIFTGAYLAMRSIWVPGLFIYILLVFLVFAFIKEIVVD